MPCNLDGLGDKVQMSTKTKMPGPYVRRKRLLCLDIDLSILLIKTLDLDIFQEQQRNERLAAKICVRSSARL
jgi:hypothetical protein